MIITLIALVVVVLGVIVYRVSYNSNKYDSENWEAAGIILFGFGIIVSAICLLTIAVNHISSDRNIEINRIKYESLLKRVEVVNSEYEDVSKSDVIKDVADWNSNVFNQRYFSSNPLTSWFYSKEVVDNLECIDY